MLEEKKSQSALLQQLSDQTAMADERLSAQHATYKRETDTLLEQLEDLQAKVGMCADGQTQTVGC